MIEPSLLPHVQESYHVMQTWNISFSRYHSLPQDLFICNCNDSCFLAAKVNFQWDIYNVENWICIQAPMWCPISVFLNISHLLPYGYCNQVPSLNILTVATWLMLWKSKWRKTMSGLRSLGIWKVRHEVKPILRWKLVDRGISRVVHLLGVAGKYRFEKAPQPGDTRKQILC